LASSYRVRILCEGEYDGWSALLRACPEASVYSSPGYLDALCRATGGSFRIVGVEKGDELVGGLAAYEERRGRLNTLSPRLLLYYNGPVLMRYDTRYPSERTSRHLKVWTALADWIEREGFDRVTLKCTPGIDDVRACLARGWSAHPSYTYVVPLDDLDRAWSRVEQNLRRLVGRSEAAGVTFDEDDDFDAFWRLHEATMDYKDRATYLSQDRFRRYWRALAEQGLCTLMHARLRDGRSVASQLVLLGPYAVAQTVSAAADPAELSLGVNAFLRWQGFRALAARGYQATDLTDAALNNVTRFKSQLGGDLALTLVLERPPSLGWRARAGVRTTTGRLRSAAGRLVRGVRPSGPGSGS
jgi:hypothetical protein